MGVENDKIKDLFSSKLGNFEPEVPASVWGGLDQLLSSQPAPPADSATSSSSSSASAGGKASLIKTIAITVGLAAAVATGILVLTPDNEKVITEDPKPEVTKVIEKEPEKIVEADSIYEAPVFVPRKSLAEEPVLVADASEPIVEDIEIEEVQEDEILLEEEKAIEIPKVAEEMVEVPLPKLSIKGLSLGVIADAGLFTNTTRGQGTDLLFSRNTRSRAFIDALEKEGGEYVLEHKQPISLGITIGKRLSPRLSIETGLIYTYLSSDIKSNSVFEIDESQSFNYLGIPISLNYTFYQLGNAKFYTSIGGMVQKDIKGQYISNMGFSKIDGAGQPSVNDIYHQEPYYIKKSIKQSNPQFSVRTTLGIAYPLYKKLYIYGTIGGAYYFDAGNEYRTIYSDKKAQLDLNLGVKVDF